MDRWQIMKNGVPIAVCNSIEEAEAKYQEYDGDEIRRISDKEDMSIQVCLDRNRKKEQA